ncbi:putative PfkB family carbohydrate kinase (Mak32) [Cladophialophora carrionii]|uniref:Putative PfkB family carbohydrate kinase (Mak32) n=1 Tax=Cladophialophora carrionii TaxID=86049 RepID=A0A1C1CI62_9EURO|nr:putative PfkB family carbohydrate kinase (Mak32) [Cladophialophora carrionii]
MGGAGTYAALGARLAAGIQDAHLVSWIVDMGADFPPLFRELINTWRTNCVFRLDLNRLTTTAWNGYGENEYRAFKYLTAKLRLDENDLSDDQALARSFHMVCSPARCISLVNGILGRRRDLLRERGRNPDDVDAELWPIFVWEPVPDLCTPEEVARLRQAAGYVNVVSPNADEFAAFFKETAAGECRETQVRWLLDPSGGGEGMRPPRTVLVIREGAQGCRTYTANNWEGLHLRAYHQSKERVTDPTGGGNTFLGALAIGLTGMTSPDGRVLQDLVVPDDQKQLLLGLIHATVAAGYAIEQIGMPAVAATDGDAWNGQRYPERFLEYLQREREHIDRQLAYTTMEP